MIKAMRNQRPNTIITLQQSSRFLCINTVNVLFGIKKSKNNIKKKYKKNTESMRNDALLFLLSIQ